ncbi:MAG: hypothetical protein FJW27_11030 [Acidimicrobiia bacterium]|nr:hypothetical protein [Acidimicrobiia bacterium]
MVAEHLSNDIRSVDATLYRHLMRLPPAHTLVVTRADLRLWRYWIPGPKHETRYRDPADYAVHFRDLFREAVRCRTRSIARVGAYLSGGLDSSSVVCMAERLRRDEMIPDVGFETFSLVFPGLDCDESQYINDVISRWDLRGHLICPDDDGGRCYHADYRAMARRFRDLPNYPNGCTADPIKQRAVERGFKILLTGFGGDDWFTGSLRHWGDSIRRGDLLTLARQIWFDRRVPWAEVSARRVLAEGVSAILDEERMGWCDESSSGSPVRGAQPASSLQRLRKRPERQPVARWASQTKIAWPGPRWHRRTCGATARAGISFTCWKSRIALRRAWASSRGLVRDDWRPHAPLLRVVRQPSAVVSPEELAGGIWEQPEPWIAGPRVRTSAGDLDHQRIVAHEGIAGRAEDRS